MSSKTSVPVVLAAVAVLVVLGLLWLRGAKDDSLAAIDRASRSATASEAPSASLDAPSPDDAAPHVDMRTAAAPSVERSNAWMRNDELPSALAPKETRAIEWQVASGCTLNGLLVDERGMPTGGHDVWLMPTELKISHYFLPYENHRVTAKARADHVGKFAFADVSPGTWWIGPAPDEPDSSSTRGATRSSQPGDNALVPCAQVIEVQAGESKLDVVVQAQRGLWISGRVLGAYGSRAKATTVIATSDDNPWGASVSTTEDGSFRIGPLKSGRYELHAFGWGMECSSMPVNANAGDEGVSLKLRSGGNIEGKLVDASGNESLHGEIMYKHRDTTMNGCTFTPTHPDGTFRLEGLGPGTYDLVARIGDGRFAMSRDIVVEAGVRVSGIVLALERGAKLTVRYEGANPLGWFQVRRDGMDIAMDTISSKQTSQVQIVPAGKLTISLHLDERADALVRDVDVAAGEEKEVVFKGDP
jgi:hypothetical protein